MNKFIFMLAFSASALLASSCSDSQINEQAENVPVEKIFCLGASSSSSEDTRACVEGTLATGNPAVVWQETDKISVWGSNSLSNNEFSFDHFGDFHNWAEFKGKVVPSNSYVLMYPYQEDATIDASGKVTARIPMVQKATKGSFDPKAAVCAVYTTTENSEVILNHACAFLKITTTKPCYSIVITPVDTEWSMAGQISFTVDSKGPKITDFPSGAQSVYLTADGGLHCTDTFEAGTYLLAVASAKSFPKFSIYVEYDTEDRNQNPYKVVEQAYSFSAAGVYNLGTAQ